MSTERKTVTFRLDPSVHAALVELAGPVPLAQYLEGLVKRVVGGKGTSDLHRQAPLPLQQRAPALPIQAPQQVQVAGLEKLTAPIDDMRELLEEVLRAVNEHRAYEQLRDAALDGAYEDVLTPVPWWRRLVGSPGGREISRAALQAAARDEAARALARWKKPNGSG